MSGITTAINALLLASFCTALDAQPRNIGTFQIGKHPIPSTREHLQALARSRPDPGCRHIRVLALIDPEFSIQGVVDAGWNLVSTAGDVVTLQGCHDGAAALYAIPGIRYVNLPNPTYPAMDAARTMVYADEVHGTLPGGLSTTYTGRGTLIGVIDTEFDTHHPAFLDSKGTTRFIALWDQSDTSRALRNRFGYGVIKNQAQLTLDPRFGQSPGQPTHGTLVASLAAGSDRLSPYYGIAPEAFLAAVKRGKSDTEIVDAIRWIFSLADSLRMPCAVNISLGHHIGPHDGTSLIDRAIDSLSRAGRIVIGAAGNDGDKMVHAAFSLSSGQSLGTWVTPVEPSMETFPRAASFIDIWGEAGKPFSATFLIMDSQTLEYRQSTQALSTVLTTLYRPDTVVWTNPDKAPDTLIFTAQIERRNPLNNRPRILATASATTSRLFLGVRLSINGGQSGIIHAWNGAKLSLRSFEMTGFIDGDTLISINEIGGTAKRNITVGACVSRLRVPLYDGSFHGPEPDTFRGFAPYSSRGPTVDGRTKPDIVAPGSEVVGAASRGAIVENTSLVLWPDPPDNTGGRYVWSGGTSLSAPIVTGIVALLLQAKSDLTPEQVRSILQTSATKDSHTGPLTSPDNKWGAGVVNALRALQTLSGATASTARAGGREPLRMSVTNRSRIIVTGYGLHTDLSIGIYSIQGRLLKTLHVDRQGQAIIPHLPPGNYLLMLNGHPGMNLRINTVL